jgi:hypothetical protein
MTDSSLVANSNFLAAPREDPSLTYASFNFGALGKHLVVGFRHFSVEREELDTVLQR